MKNTATKNAKQLKHIKDALQQLANKLLNE